MTRNVALILIDTVRKDYFDEYAPRLQAMSDISIDRCRAASSWSVPSHASMFTGDLPSEHDIHTHDRVFDLERSDTFLAGVPHGAYGASSNVYASSTFGFDAIFDEYRDVAPHRIFPAGMDMEQFVQERETDETDGARRFLEFFRTALAHDAPAKTLVNGVVFKLNATMRTAPVPKLIDDGARAIGSQLVELARTRPEPLFLFANFMDAHAPHQHVLGYDRSIHDAPYGWSSLEFETWDRMADRNEVPEREFRRDRRYHRQLYAAAIDYLDRTVTDTIERLRDETAGETTVVVTADHGENLGYDADDGLFDHTSSLTDGLVHVPLEIINPPEGMDAPDDGEYVTHLDLGELIVDIADEDREASVPTREIAPAELIGCGLGVPDDVDDEYWDRMIRAVYRDDRKYEWDSMGNTFVYDVSGTSHQKLRSDGDGVPDWCRDEFDVPIEAYKDKARRESEAVDLDEATVSRLEDLGYV
ncbi:sulfatase-like hydrolase/transferase [Halopiger djelfimassiliensis]|uniref:sulfatase-like hydrolase/transferase n=1 Tax=Halopiger djelfimassiliensis TaxID=1293047 RepID=UPI0006780B19|nr:sulfatase-like hydrolase/transferase [Halopiger djelfimassiliensis]